jgi:hypothetical protein
MDVLLAGVVARERLLYVFDKLGEFGLVVRGDALACCSPFGFGGLMHHRRGYAFRL